MTPRERLSDIMRGMQEDLAGYKALHALLERQFDAAVRHDTQTLEGVAESIVARVAALERSRSARVEHTAALLGPGVRPSMTELMRRLSGPTLLQLTGLWSQLESQVRDCKALNLRNCRLIMEQGEVMRRVLVGEEGIYAPA